MINIKKISKLEPFSKFTLLYKKALKENQDSIDAIHISSFNIELNEVNSRVVNLKYIIDTEFIFFSNYNSIKGKEFKLHDQIAATIFWPAIRSQIRIKAKIFKTSKTLSDKHYATRDRMKNILAHSSVQSKKINSYEAVTEKFNALIDSNTINQRPDYWGGYSFKPYYFEFWSGHPNRINKREVYELLDEKNNRWKRHFLEP